MIITISGRPGSGKSTVAKEVAKKLNLKYYCIGDFQRQLARKKGISLVELGELEEKDRSIDLEIDRMQEELGRNEDNIIVDSRIGFHFIPDSIKVFLDVDLDKGAERIFSQKRKDERFSTLEKTKEELKKRVASEKKRYKEYYGIGHYDMRNYDFMVDTTDKSIVQAADEVARKAKSHQKL